MVESGLGGGDPADVAGLATWLRGWPAPFPDREAFLAFFGGSRSVAVRMFDGVGASLSMNWRARSSMSRPDGASDSVVVRPRLKTGSKRWFSQPVVSG